MRNIFILSKAILDCIPDDEEYTETKKHIMSLEKSYLYKAPELWCGWFDSMNYILTNKIGEPNTPWKVIIKDIFTDRISAEVLKKWEKEK